MSLQRFSVYRFEQGLDFGEVLDAGGEFGTGGNVEGGGPHAASGQRGVVRHDATGENHGKLRMLCAEFTGDVPIENPTGTAIAAGRMGIQQDGCGTILGGVGEVGTGFDAKRFNNRDVGRVKVCGVGGGFIAMELNEIEQAIADELQRQFRRGIDEDADTKNPAGE